ncbi:Hypothetical protein NTJ_04655 [Nesidiocoris tenuis]|uniref:Cytochrome c domain-containing protein n=1 Tax=Nesidiocoris tenuis TaxID=355587 RepID=A0ABN7AKM4_9HEMI|nr:Hypothetical protein NTJ_04655 [Nesidiocoris tenuis]
MVYYGDRRLWSSASDGNRQVLDDSRPLAFLGDPDGLGVAAISVDHRASPRPWEGQAPRGRGTSAFATTRRLHPRNCGSCHRAGAVLKRRHTGGAAQ